MDPFIFIYTMLLFIHCFVFSFFLAINRKEMLELIKDYFKKGYTYLEIIQSLQRINGISISLRKLHRILRENNLYRKKNKTPTGEVIQFISQQLSGSGSAIGYRQMHQRCVLSGQRVNRKTVLLIMRELDPNGIEMRKRHCLRRRSYYSYGPNYVWHIDGYDKLKPFGFSIHGSIDGYSRKIMWLKLSRSNKQPKNICDYFVETCKEIGGFPRKIVGDRGTENVYIAACQRFLRRHGNDPSSGHNSFQYGRSVSNQRIEGWWSQLRRSSTDWWMTYFKNLVFEGHYDTSDPIQVECILYTYAPLLLAELENMKLTWNNHRIRPSYNFEANLRPAGRPNILYNTPGQNIINYKHQLDNEDMQVVEQLCCNTVPEDFICSKQFFELATILMNENNLSLPFNHEQAFILYKELLRLIQII